MPWGIVATIGDPVLILVPLAAATFGILGLLGGGVTTAPACASAQGCATTILVPLWSLPPLDAYQDAGVVQMVASQTAVIWALRILALVLRTIVFGAAVYLAVQRARDRVPDVRGALRALRERFASLLVIELVSFGLFGIPLVLGQGSLVAPGRQVSQLGALVGEILLINAFFAAFSERSAWRALRAGLRWMVRRPAGHLVVAVVATAGLNGVFWLARAGETGRERPLTLAVFTLVHALGAMIFLSVFARRFVLLYEKASEQ